MLTDAGTTLAAELHQLRHAQGDALFDRLSDREQATLRRLLTKVLSTEST